MPSSFEYVLAVSDVVRTSPITLPPHFVHAVYTFNVASHELVPGRLRLGVSDKVRRRLHGATDAPKTRRTPLWGSTMALAGCGVGADGAGSSTKVTQ